MYDYFDDPTKIWCDYDTLVTNTRHRHDKTVKLSHKGQGSKPDPSMKLLATLVVAAFGQDYDFYSSGEAYRFGSVGDFSHTQSDTSSPALAYGPDGSVIPIDSHDNDSDATTIDANTDSQFAHLTSSGEFADATRYLRYGHGGNRRYCHTTRNNRAVYNWTSHAYGGYFAEGRNFMECMGEELYCFIEERAHYGQIIGITAGCEQMMNHPSVTIQDQQALINASYTQINAIKNNYNQEAARGGANRHGFFTYYGLGGCLAMPAQNGHHLINDRARPDARGTWPDATGSGLQTNELRHPEYHRQGVDSSSWRSYKWLNYYRNFHGGYGQNQCLRFPKQRLNDDATSTVSVGTICATGTSDTQCQARVNSSHIYNSPGNLLPFGVSVCRACCVAEFSQDATFGKLVGGTQSDSDDAEVYKASTMLCNYPPDNDTNVKAVTHNQFEELIPRFDMSGPAYNAFQTPNENGSQMMPDRDNNLFVHGSWCDEPGPARGCARVPNFNGTNNWDVSSGSTGATDLYVYGTDLTSHTYGSARTWKYTCKQSTSGITAGVTPIGSAANRDWCPGRPWLASSYNDSSHTKPTAGDATTHNIIG